MLKAAIKPVELVSNLASGAASAMFPPSAMCFGAVMFLIDTAHGVSASLDAIAELLDLLKEFTIRLKVYQREDLSQELRENLTEILVGVLVFIHASFIQLLDFSRSPMHPSRKEYTLRYAASENPMSTDTGLCSIQLNVAGVFLKAIFLQ